MDHSGISQLFILIVLAIISVGNNYIILTHIITRVGYHLHLNQYRYPVVLFFSTFGHNKKCKFS